MSEILIATTDAVVNVDGELVTIRKDVTRVEADHPLAKKNAALFKPVSEGVHFAVRTARKEPKVGKRTAKKAAAEPKVQPEAATEDDGAED